MDVAATSLPFRQDIVALDPGAPFTPAMAARAGIGRSMLERMVRAGQVVRLVRGAYLAADVPSTALVRARAVGLVIGPRQLVVHRTAAWVHGAPALRSGPEVAIPLDLDGRRRFPAGRAPVRPADVALLAGVRFTTPARTALDVARHLAPERALPLLDGMLRAGAVTYQALVDVVAAHEHLQGIDRARELVAVADGRADGIAESVLRQHWLGAALPTPVPGLRVAGVRVALALPLHRFGAVLAGSLSTAQSDVLARAGWAVLVLDADRVRRSDPRSTSGHLEREFHLHLLRQMG